MSNIKLYNDAFKTVFSAEEKNLDELFCKENVENWDSLRQLCLVTTIEDAFGIMLDPEDIVAFDAYEKGRVILKKYDIVL